MADLNALVSQLTRDCSEISEQLNKVYRNYEVAYQESVRELLASRTASGGSMDGLHEFQVASNSMRRNRDILQSLIKGFSNLRPLGKYKFIEEEYEAPRRRKPPAGSMPVPQPAPSNPVSPAEAKKIDEMTIPEGHNNA